MPDKQQQPTANSQQPTAVERMQAVIDQVTDWQAVDMDALYDEHFPHEVDRFDFRAACRNAACRQAAAKAAAKTPSHQQPATSN